MTISSSIRKAGPFTGNGATVAFPFTFKVFTASDLYVVQALTLTGVESVKTLTTDYTVTLNADQNATPGGTVTMLVAPPSGYTLTLTSQVANLQPVDLQNAGGFYPSVINTALDKATIQIQQLAERVSRALLSTVSTSSAAVLPVPSATKVLAWNAAGTNLENVDMIAGQSNLATGLAASTGASLVGFIQSGTGAVARTVQDKARESVSVIDFGAVGNGVTDDTAAIQAASNSLVSGQTLYFPSGTYLVSYIWTAYTDTTSDNVGKGRAVCYINLKQNITFKGDNVTILCNNHNITTYGGFLFCLVEGSPGFTIDGFNFVMSFTGYNNSASYYPFVGAVVAFDVVGRVSNSPTTMCNNFKARNLTFNLFHPNGCFAITAFPFGGSDVNNGYKMFAVSLFGDTAATDTTKQNRGILLENIRFLKGHNGYGLWYYAFHSVTVRNIYADAWVTAQYTIATLTMAGISYVGVLRCQQYNRFGLTIDNVQVQSLPWASRTGSYVGNCGGLAIGDVTTTDNANGASISNCLFILDNNSTTVTTNYDVGILSQLSGSVEITNCTFETWTSTGAWAYCIQAQSIGADTTGRTNYTITNNIVNKSICGPFVQIYTLNGVGDTSRTIKSVTITNNIIEGWGAEGSVTIPNSATYYGVENLVVSNNVFAGVYTAITNTGNCIYAPTRTNADNVIISGNVLKNGAYPYWVTSANAFIVENALSGNVSSPVSPNLAYSEGTWTPAQGAGLTVVGAFSSSGNWTRIGRQVTVNGQLIGATSVAVSAGGVLTNNLPFTVAGFGTGSATNAGVNATSVATASGTTVYSSAAITANANISFSATFFV